MKFTLQMCHLFYNLNLTAKTALKSVDFDEVTDKNKMAPFYGPRCILPQFSHCAPRLAYNDTMVEFFFASVRIRLLLSTLFTARRSYASAVLGVVILSVRLSVCLSVRPSDVFLSHACFVTNSKNLQAIFYTTRKGNPSSFLTPEISSKFQRGHPRRGGAK